MSARSDPHDDKTSSALEARRIYLSCSPEDLIAVEMVAWREGFDAAGEDDALATLDIQQIERRAEQTCDDTLERYVPMNVEQYRDVFVRGWCGGYCSRVGESSASWSGPMWERARARRGQ